MSKQIRILVVTNPSSPATDYYRTVGPYSNMSRAYPTVIRYQHEMPEYLKWHHIYDNDVIIFQRPNGKQLGGFIAEAWRANKKIILDFDDLLHEVTDANPASTWFNRPDVKKSIEEVFQYASHVTVSTPYLKAYYSKFVNEDKITIIPNCYIAADGAFTPIRQSQKPYRMLWRGSATHITDLYTIEKPLKEAIENDAFAWSFIGMEKWIFPWLPRDRVSWVSWLPMFSFFNLIRENQPDWGVFPLEINNFNRSKSNNFAMELLKNGAAVIAQGGLPEFEIPGVITYNTPEELSDIFQKISTGEISKEQHVIAGREWMSENREINKFHPLRLEVIQNVLR